MLKVPATARLMVTRRGTDEDTTQLYDQGTGAPSRLANAAIAMYTQRSAPRRPILERLGVRPVLNG